MALTDSEVRTILFTEAKTTQAVYDNARNTADAMLVIANNLDSDTAYDTAIVQWAKFRAREFYPAMEYLANLRKGWDAFTGEISL